MNKLNLDQLTIKSFVTKKDLVETKGGVGSIITTAMYTDWRVCETQRFC